MDQQPSDRFQRIKVGINTNCSIPSQVADQLRWLIVTGEIKVGEKLPPVRNLADQLKVNLHTVRAAYRVLEDSHLIETRQGLGSVVVEYAPSETVTSNELPTHTIGIIVPDLQNPFYPALLSGAAKVAREHNVLMITCDTKEQVTTGKAFFDMLISKRVDGMLISPMGASSSTADFFSNSEFFDFPIPLVFIDRPDVKGYSVLLDARGSGFKATRHLIEHGHQQIGMFTGDLCIPTLHECYEGYLSALDSAGIHYDPAILVEVKEFSYEAGYRAALQLIQKSILPKAIFAAGDMLAIGAMKALRENHIRVPQDVAIAGYNDIDVSNYVTPALTSVTIPVAQMGEASANLLIQLLNNQAVNRKPVLMPTELIIRESCGCRPK
jgi:LacI family transcriptional regulator